MMEGAGEPAVSKVVLQIKWTRFKMFPYQILFKITLDLPVKHQNMDLCLEPLVPLAWGLASDTFPPLLDSSCVWVQNPKEVKIKGSESGD